MDSGSAVVKGIPSSIKITKSQLDFLVNIAKGALPIESCAILLGNGFEKITAVTEILPMKNTDDSRITFSIDPKDLFDAYSQAEKKGKEVIGIFHSHPARAYPSSTDKKFMEINPVAWIIYSTTDHEMKAFIMDDAVRELEVIVQ